MKVPKETVRSTSAVSARAVKAALGSKGMPRGSTKSRWVFSPPAQPTVPKGAFATPAKL